MYRGVLPPSVGASCETWVSLDGSLEISESSNRKDGEGYAGREMREKAKAIV